LSPNGHGRLFLSPNEGLASEYMFTKRNYLEQRNGEIQVIGLK